MKTGTITAGILLAGGLALGAGTTNLAMAGPDTNVLNVGIAAPDAGRLDPHLSATTIDKAVFGWMFNGLVRFAPGTASPETIEPDLAESWESSDDGLEWTFHLRDGVQCHHGYGELTAEDIVYSLERAADPNRSSFASDFDVFEKVEAVDDPTVKITLKNAVPSLLGLVTNYHGGNIVCKAAAEEMGEDFQKRPIGTGPFMFEQYTPQQNLKLAANPDYFRGKPKLDGINYQYIPSDSARDLAFQSGELDMVYGKQDQTWAERTGQMDDVVVHVMEPAEMSVMYLNTATKPLDDIRVRRAMAMATNRDQFMEFKGRDVTREANSVVPQGYLGHADMSSLMPGHDIEAAKALLAEAGHPDGVTLKVIHTALPGMLGTMEVFQAQMAAGGHQARRRSGRARHLPRADPQGPEPGGALLGRPVPRRRHLPDPVLPLGQHRRHADRHHELHALLGRRRGDRGGADRAESGEAEGALGDRAAQAHGGDLRHPDLREPADLGDQEEPGPRL